MKVVSVINYKGGVGKTTLTANLGAYAASKDKRVLMIDLDPQASLTFSFVKPEDWRYLYAEKRTMKNYFEPIITGQDGTPSLKPLIIPLNLGNPLGLGSEKLHLVSSHLKLIDIDIKLAGLINVTNPQMWASSFLKTAGYLKNSLIELENDYDLILIDCPPSSNLVVKNAMLASDSFIVPAKMDYLSTLGIEHLMENVKEFFEEYEKHRKIFNAPQYSPASINLLGIVPMMVTILKDNGENSQLIAAENEFMEKLKNDGYYLFTPVRNNGTMFGKAPLDGKPVVLTRPKFYHQSARKIVNELEKLCDEFLRRI